jgi:chromosome segregation ATPase
MPEAEYQDKKELEGEVKEYAQEIEQLGESQKDHQEDLIKLQKTLISFQRSKGFDKVTDNKVMRYIESAIDTRDRSIDECKENISAAKQKIESTKTKLETVAKEGEAKLKEAEDVNKTLNHKNPGLEDAIETEKKGVSDFKKNIQTLAQIAVAAGELIQAPKNITEGISFIVQSLQNLGMLK